MRNLKLSKETVNLKALEPVERPKGTEPSVELCAPDVLHPPIFSDVQSIGRAPKKELRRAGLASALEIYE